MLRFENILHELNKDTNLDYVGRHSSASSATGSGKKHQAELKELLSKLFLKIIYIKIYFIFYNIY